jgi:phosphatase NudJ
MNTRWKPSVTVAAVIERDGLFLLVEEHTPEGLRLNNPAGHLEAAESPAEGCAREVLEETAHPFTATALVGVYLSRFQRQRVRADAEAPVAEDTTYLRFTYCGDLGPHDSSRPLDHGIVRTVWMSADEIRQSTARHRSPLVLQCLEDYLAGQRFPLHLVHTGKDVYTPTDLL